MYVFQDKSFIAALNRCDKLQNHLESMYPKHMKAAETWKKTLGVNCGRYRGILRMVYAMELERDPNAFEELLRQADYSV